MYELTESPNIIKRVADSAFIPNDPGNRDYQDYLAWVAAGNTPGPINPPPAVPDPTGDYRANALALIDSAEGSAKAARALLLALVDEVNELRQRFNDLQADVQSSANIAQVKPKWALRLTLPARTGAGIKAAMVAKVTTGAADSAL